MPADEADVQVRIEGLRRRAAAIGEQVPMLDPDGLLHLDGALGLAAARRSPPDRARCSSASGRS